MVKLNIRYWVRFSLVNLAIVAALGVLMRYKIGFEFPFFNQKFIQHAHSHFAFAGWITHTLITLMTWFLHQRLPLFSMNKYQWLIITNMICAYGMLFSFAAEGYGTISITFSTLSVLVSWTFAWIFWRDSRPLLKTDPAIKWFYSALIFNVISALGTFYLARMMATGDYHTDRYLMSVYFYLHFQYNGWFLFACLGLASGYLTGLKGTPVNDLLPFRILTVSCIPTYLLSILWIDLAMWVYVLVVASALAQLYGWWLIIVIVRSKLIEIKNNLSAVGRFLFVYVAIALTIKMLLQLGSTIPSVSHMAFSFRPIVIAYLHLVLLAVISVSVIALFYAFNLVNKSKSMHRALLTFLASVFLNELVLAIQGAASISYTLVPGVNWLLLVVSVLILVAVAGMLWANERSFVDRGFSKFDLISKNTNHS
jgi:hypothetical protein